MGIVTVTVPIRNPILVLGALIARGNMALLLEPQTILLLAIGALLTVLQPREIFRRAWQGR
jgi:hypothetical protein